MLVKAVFNHVEKVVSFTVASILLKQVYEQSRTKKIINYCLVSGN